jgi:Ser/Thr protein kinase RdoA (MazF antagonist)
MADVTDRTQTQRSWLEIGALALRRWRLRADSMRLLAYGNKAVIRVTAADADYVLRLHPAESVNVKWLRSELAWLVMLRRSTDLLAPYPIAAPINGGEQVLVEMHTDQLPAAPKVYASLFEYIEGDVMSARDLRPIDVFGVGEFLGKLHTIGQYSPPEEFDRPALSWDGLFGDDSLYASAASELISREQHAVLVDLREKLRRALSRAVSSDDAAGLIHADLLAKNMVFRQPTIGALDFEYCGWGFYLYDLAPLLWQLKGERARDYTELEEAVWRGYTSVRPVAEGDRKQLEHFIAARQFASIRWLLANLGSPAVRQAAPSLIAERCRELEAYLDSGVMQRSTATL